ncbi:MAG: hypothetical protein HRU26_16180, partial [Psychroserpens sp.]|nr:hypothetical protein [Psychroserpens sp.]
KLDSGEKVALEYHIGSSEDKQFWLFAPELEFEALPLGDEDGIRTVELEAMLTGAANGADDEWQMVWIGN